MSAGIETTDDDATWTNWLSAAGVDDVYYSARYARIWAREERGRFMGIRHDSSFGHVLYPVILVPLDSLPGGAGLLEARTPYDFGGPRARSQDLEKLHREFRDAVVERFRKLNVVSEFARLHPLASTGLPPDARPHAQNYVIDLTKPHPELFASQHRRFRRAVRAFSRRHDAPEVLTTVPSEDASSFAELYELTMGRVGAAADYYFGRDTLSELASLDEMMLVRVRDGRRIAGAALFLRSDRNLFYFLGASANEKPAGTNSAIFDAAVRHAQSEGLRTLHLGGGSESLREFKSQMATGTIPYHLLKRVVDPQRYSALCEASGTSDATCFPGFRSKLVESRRA